MAPAPVHAVTIRRRLAAGVLAGALVLASGCGTDDSADVDTSSTTTASEPTTTADPTTTTEGAPSQPGPVGGWEQVDVGDVAPPPRSGAVLVAAPNGDLWLHGGLVDTEPLSDLWRFDGERWEERTVDGGPTARSEHAAVWDAERDRLVVALGEGSSKTVFDDVWAFDPASSTWTELPSGGPAARYGQCTVLDRDGRMVITHGFSLQERFGDTWAYDLASEAWTDITPEGDRPSNRCLHACGYDDETGELTLFGGRTDEQPYLGDTWRLGSDGWTEVATDGPAARARSRGAFTDRFLVFGGQSAEGLADDAWVLGADGWQPGPADTPAQRRAAAVAEADGVVWVFGGLGDDGPLADLWRSS